MTSFRGRASSLTTLAAFFSGLSCVTTQPISVPPPVNVSSGPLAAPSQPAPGGEVGIEVEANENDSLEKLEVLPGVRVRSVAGGGAGAAAGVQAGDVVLTVDGAPVNHPDAFEALARGAAPGRELRLEVRRDTTVFEARVTVGAPAHGAPPVELYRADPLKLRAGFRTVAVEGPGGRRTAAELVRLFPESPLEGAGLRPGDRIVSLSGTEVSSAEELVRALLEDHEFGERVKLEVRRGTEGLAPAVKLWAPRRHLTKLVLPVLFNYEWRLSPRRTQWALLDFWLFSFFQYRREEGEKEMKFFSLIRFRSGYGELIEEPRPAGEAR